MSNMIIYSDLVQTDSCLRTVEIEWKQKEKGSNKFSLLQCSIENKLNKDVETQSNVLNNNFISC